jgi:hypothetical protein
VQFTQEPPFHILHNTGPLCSECINDSTLNQCPVIGEILWRKLQFRPHVLFDELLGRPISLRSELGDFAYSPDDFAGSGSSLHSKVIGFPLCFGFFGGLVEFDDCLLVAVGGALMIIGTDMVLALGKQNAIHGSRGGIGPWRWFLVVICTHTVRVALLAAKPLLVVGVAVFFMTLTGFRRGLLGADPLRFLTPCTTVVIIGICRPPFACTSLLGSTLAGTPTPRPRLMIWGGHPATRTHKSAPKKQATTKGETNLGNRMGSGSAAATNDCPELLGHL